MDINRIARASNAIIGGEAVDARLAAAIEDLVALDGTAQADVQQTIRSLIDDGQEALDSGDHDAQADVAKRIVRYYEDLRRS